MLVFEKNVVVIVIVVVVVVDDDDDCQAAIPIDIAQAENRKSKETKAKWSRQLEGARTNKQEESTSAYGIAIDYQSIESKLLHLKWMPCQPDKTPHPQRHS